MLCCDMHAVQIDFAFTTNVFDQLLMMASFHLFVILFVIHSFKKKRVWICYVQAPLVGFV